MRNTFVQTVRELARRDPRVWLLCGDLGYSVLEGFAEEFPKRYVNVGVAEQNMAGMAAGLAHSGQIVYIYSIANFPVFRCLEQIRNDICYHNLPVRVVAVGGGLAYGAQGYTHHGVEDLAVTRVLPNMTVFAPGDPVETRLVTEASLDLPGPCYIRLGKANEPVVHPIAPQFRVGKGISLKVGRDANLVATGGILGAALAAAEMLRGEGIDCGVASFPTVSPLDEELLAELAGGGRALATVEEHGLGGLGSAVAEWAAAQGGGIRLKALRLPREPFTTAGSQDYLRGLAGLSPEGIARAVGGWLR